MLRSLVLALLTVNLGFFGWTHGWLHSWVGVPPEGHREPQRLNAQLNAQQIEVIRAPESVRNHALRRRAGEPAAAASSPASAVEGGAAAGTNGVGGSGSEPATAAASVAAVAPQAGGLCIEAGPFNADDATSVDRQLRPLLPANSWGKQSIPISGQWMVYMGPYPNEELYDRKVAELKRIRNLPFDEVRSGPYARGLSLGRFTSEGDAEARLSGLRQRGIRTARVITLRPAGGQVHYLRVAQATEGMQVTLSSLKLPQGKSFTACRS